MTVEPFDYARLHAAHIGSMASPDPSSHVGAVLKTLEGGDFRDCNHFTRGVSQELGDELVIDRDRKYMWIEHAERNVIFQATRAGASCLGATMWCTWGPCSNCARAVAQSGIARFVRHADSRPHWPERWAHDLAVADEILAAAGVEVVEYSGFIGGVEGLVNGKVWYP